MARCLRIFAFFLVLLVASSSDAVPSQVYWKAMLPNTPMPRSITDLLRTGMVGESKGTVVNVGRDGVHVGTGKGQGGDGTDVNVGHGGVEVHTTPKKKPVVVLVKPYASPFNYMYSAKDDQLQHDPNVALFFLEKDMHPGTTMNLQFSRTTSNAAPFLPRKIADSTPFTSIKLPDILARFSIQPSSTSAETMANTIKECEAPSIQGEKKLCATSLESMIDFATTSLESRELLATSTIVGNHTSKNQQYTILTSPEKIAGEGGEKTMSCHAQPYVYAVFFCHVTRTSKVYQVPMAGADGTRVDAVAVCHTNTSKWNPDHLAFRVLKVKPGTVPVCHFLPEDHVVWTVKY